jgi:hypothetical protein
MTDTLTEALDEVRKGLQAMVAEFAEAMLPAVRRFVDAVLPIIWELTGDCIKTGEPPYGGIWSRHQMKAR